MSFMLWRKPESAELSMWYEHPAGKIFYKTEGTGKILLILHGFAVDHTMMHGLLEPEFAGKEESWMRVYVDLPGMGKSDPLEPDDYADQASTLLLCFMKETFPGRKYGILSHSYGAYLARKMIYDHPGNIQGAFFISPVVYPMKEDRTLPAFEKWKALPELGKADPRIYQSYTESAVVETFYGWDLYRRTVYPVLKRLNRENVRFYQKKGYACSVDVNCLPAPFRGPSVFLMGRQDHITGYQDPLVLQHDYPEGDFILLAGAGHYPFYERKEFFFLVMGRWLGRI